MKHCMKTYRSWYSPPVALQYGLMAGITSYASAKLRFPAVAKFFSFLLICMYFEQNFLFYFSFPCSLDAVPSISFCTPLYAFALRNYTGLQVIRIIFVLSVQQKTANQLPPSGRISYCDNPLFLKPISHSYQFKINGYK
jgi:hypothetical protein